jgi:hypothetical protein
VSGASRRDRERGESRGERGDSKSFHVREYTRASPVRVFFCVFIKFISIAIGFEELLEMLT